LQLVTLAEVYTAVPLSDIQKQALQNKLQLMTDSKDIRLIMHINTDLIGLQNKLQLMTNSKDIRLIMHINTDLIGVIDMSIYGQLNQISSYLNGAII